MDDENFRAGKAWLYRSGDERLWHAWNNGVHTVWYAVVDDFGNLVMHRSNWP